jgi:hypothetical protein
MSDKKTTREFSKEDLIDCVDGDSNVLEKIEVEMIDTRRWSIDYLLTFKDVETGLFYQTTYSSGATECQDESPFEYDPDMVICTRVEQVEKLVKVWEAVNE